MPYVKFTCGYTMLKGKVIQLNKLRALISTANDMLLRATIAIGLDPTILGSPAVHDVVLATTAAVLS